MNFGEIIKKLRIKKDWTQEYVAKKLNISVGALSRYETDIRNIEDDFNFAYHKEIEGLTEDEIKEALEFYKMVKNRKNKEK